MTNRTSKTKPLYQIHKECGAIDGTHSCIRSSMRWADSVFGYVIDLELGRCVYTSHRMDARAAA